MRAVLNVLAYEPPLRRSRDRGARAYSVVEARALFELAESCPSPEVFARERARILGES